MSTGNRVFVIGVGMTKFERCERDVKDLAGDATRDALKDAGIGYDEIGQAFVGYINGMSTLGQQALYRVGMTGIPVYNVNNNCSTGSTALYMAYNAVRFGQNDAVLALGFEKMQKGPLENQLPGLEKLKEETEKEKKPPIAARMFGDAGRDHMEKYGTKKETFAKIAVKNHRHSVNNPRSQYQQACTIEEVFASRLIYDPAFVARKFARRRRRGHIAGPPTLAIEIVSPESVFRDYVQKREVYEQAGVGPEDAQVIELHDCFSTNELITYEGLGLCKEGEGERLVEDDATSYGGKWVVNPSGGLLSKGHPLGATGLAQCAELNWQLRGQAEQRQVEGAKLALQHNLGLGGACVVTMYKKA